MDMESTPTKGKGMDQDTILSEFIEAKHRGQVDKQGYDYFRAHLRAVAISVPAELYIAALAHDLLEDTDATVEEMKDVGFSDRDVILVQTLTKGKWETLEDYCNRVRRDTQAIEIKIADVANNLTRISGVSAYDQVRLTKKYNRTLCLLAGLE